MTVSRIILAQWVVLGITLGAAAPPPLPSYNFGITGEPTKVDTAFGNLGELGPIYNVPEAQNDSTATSRGIPQLSTTYVPVTETTEPPKIVQPTTTTVAQTGQLNNSDVESLTTVKTTDGEEITFPGSGNVLNGSSSKEAPFESSTITNPTQTFETTTVLEVRTTSTTTRNNTTPNSSSVTNIDTEVTNSPGGSPYPSTSSSSPSTPSSTPSLTQGNTTQTTPDGPLRQTFHTGSLSSTDTPIISPSPGHNETKPGQNSTIPSKPNSSLSLYPNSGNIWLASFVIHIYVMNIK